MFRALPILFCLLLFCCKTNGKHNEPDFSKLNEEDSLEVVCLMVADLKREMFEQFILVNKDTSSLSSYLPNIIICQIDYRNILNIQINNNGQIMFRNDLVDKEEISALIVEYYSKNAEYNDVTNNFPMYTWVNKEVIKSNLSRLIIELSQLKKLDPNSSFEYQEMIDFKNKQIKEWKRKLAAINILKIKELPEVHFQTKIEVEKESNGNYHPPIVESVLFGIMRLRNQSAQKYFKESLFNLFCRSLNEKNNIDSNKLRALEVLHPVQVIDKNNLKKYNLIVSSFSSEIPPPPSP